MHGHGSPQHSVHTVGNISVHGRSVHVDKLCSPSWIRIAVQRSKAQKEMHQAVKRAYLNPSPFSMPAKGRSKVRATSSGMAVRLAVPAPIVRRGNAKKSVAENADNASKPSKAVRRMRLRCIQDKHRQNVSDALDCGH